MIIKLKILDPLLTIKAISQLELFIFLNYMGVLKILKKNDKITGLRFSSTYLYRISNLNFAKNRVLSDLKSELKSTLEKRMNESPNRPPKRRKSEQVDSKDAFTPEFDKKNDPSVRPPKRRKSEQVDSITLPKEEVNFILLYIGYIQ